MYHLPTLTAIKNYLPAWVPIENCGICWNPLENDVTNGNCKHRFHRSCLKTWASVDRVANDPSGFPCPLCRGQLEMSIFLTKKERCIIELRALKKDALEGISPFGLILASGSLTGVVISAVEKEIRDGKPSPLLYFLAAATEYVAASILLAGGVSATYGFLKRHCRLLP